MRVGATARARVRVRPTLAPSSTSAASATWIDSKVATDIGNDTLWQAWWPELAVMPLRRYDVPSRKVRRHFVGMLGEELWWVR